VAASLLPRLHAGQLEYGAGIQLAVELKAASVDHCTYASDADLDALAAAADTTVATLLPGAEFSTRAQWPNARRFIDAGVTVALATDCNPGSSFTSSMSFCIAVAVRDMYFTPAQALWSATAGGWPRGAAPTSSAWTPRPTFTWPTGRVSHWCATSSRGESGWWASAQRIHR
jgi:imidazolonepropionase